MDKNMYIKELKQYIDGSKSQLLSYATATGWKPNLKQFQERTKDIKPKGLVNHQHDHKYISMIYTIKEHVRNAGRSMEHVYSHANELPDPIPKHFLGHKNMAIIISDDVKLELFKSTRTLETLPASPVTSDDYFADYTPEERDLLYKFVVSNCVKVMPPQDLVVDNPPEISDLSINSTDNENEELLRLERLKVERDLKRRRQAYRRKVSTKNKSQVEVTREVIANVMEALGYTTEAPIKQEDVKATISNINTDFNSENQLGVWASPPVGFDTFRFSRKRDFLKSRRDMESFENKDCIKMDHQSKCYEDWNRPTSESRFNSRKSFNFIKSSFSTISEKKEVKMRNTSTDSEKIYRSSHSAKRLLDSEHEKRSSRPDYDRKKYSSSHKYKRYYKELDSSCHKHKDLKHEKLNDKADHDRNSYPSSYESKNYYKEKDSFCHSDDYLKHEKGRTKSDYDRNRHSSSHKRKSITK